MPPVDTAAERDDKRSAVADANAVAREAIEKQYTADKVALEEEYLAALEANRADLREAYVAAGLNPDGSDPQGRPQG